MLHEKEKASANGSGSGSGSGASAMEPLACVSCRARKLKCDRTKPACARCLKVSSKCVYPESRRKPAVKRRNVRELEARLAQVEDYLKEVNRHSEGPAGQASSEDIEIDNDDIDIDGDIDVDGDVDIDPPSQEFGFENVSPTYNSTEEAATVSQQDTFASDFAFGNDQLMGMGLSESLPPFEMMEELNARFFRLHYFFNPVVHQGLYYQSFYGGPLKKPPMCLQYIIWTIGSMGHERYGRNSEALYKRARQYADADEMKDYGEHLVTVSHAQTWVLIASFEAKQMLFTRAAVSAARAIKLIHMMGLHRLDEDPSDVPRMLAPARSWAEEEERRRVFWGAYILDSHATIATGWPSLIRLEDTSVRLPASEESFQAGKAEKSAWLEEVFDGASYSSFAGTILTCYVYKDISPHLYRPQAKDRPQDFTSGPFWKRHRDLDTKLSNLISFLPEQYRLPSSKREPTAVSININLQAAVVCLQHGAVDMACKHNLPEGFKKASMARLRAGAEEIVSILKIAGFDHAALKSPLGGISLYVATTVYVYAAKENPTSGLSSVDRANLDVILQAMDYLAQNSLVLYGLVRQVCQDIERNNLSTVIKSPIIIKYRDLAPSSSGPFPRGPRMATMPPRYVFGRLPLKDPKGVHSRINGFLVNTTNPPNLLQPPRKYVETFSMSCFQGIMGGLIRNLGVDTKPGHDCPYSDLKVGNEPEMMAAATMGGDTANIGTGFGSGPPAPEGTVWMPDLNALGSDFPMGATVLPDRTNSSVASSPQYRTTTGTQSASSHTSPGIGLGNTVEENRIDIRAYQDRLSTSIWQTTEADFLSQTEAVMNFALPGDGSDPWGVLAANSGNWNNDRTTG